MTKDINVDKSPYRNSRYMFLLTT